MPEHHEAPSGGAAPLEGFIALFFFVAMLAAVGLAVVYALGGQPQLEGVLLFISLGGMAIGLAVWAHHFLPEGGEVQERHLLRSTPEEREAFAEAFARGERQLTRRKLLVALFSGSVAALLGAALFPIRSLGGRPLPALATTAWAAGLRLVDDQGHPVNRDAVAIDGVVTVFPEGNQSPGDSQTLLLHLEPGVIRPRPGFENDSPDGFIAYSKVCTHAGCPVGLYQAATHQLVCPCHQSLFDVTDGARPVFGPATRSLPQLPIEIDSDGYFRARSDFREPIGPGYWNR